MIDSLVKFVRETSGQSLTKNGELFYKKKGIKRIRLIKPIFDRNYLPLKY